LKTGYDYRHHRFSDAETGRFLTVDPLANQFPSWSPYNYTEDNPVNKIDPLGLSANPIYGTDGAFLGTDDLGLQGQAIIMNRSDFTQGMRHTDAVSKNLGAAGLNGAGARSAFISHFRTLRGRPDYDGFVTINDGVAWGKSHPNALKNPTPDNTLYANSALLDFGNISEADFPSTNKLTPINLLNNSNLKASITNGTLRGTVYALGRVDMMLTNRNAGTVKILDTDATDYDWNQGGGMLRSTLINIDRVLEGVNDTHGFSVKYYGTGTLNH
jgi:uncharacterized protein RhaS with RHS repeats